MQFTHHVRNRTCHKPFMFLKRLQRWSSGQDLGVQSRLDSSSMNYPNLQGVSIVYSIVTVRDIVRIPPREFGDPIDQAALTHLRKSSENVLDRDVGLMIAVIGIDEIGQGRLMPGDGATYHQVTYRVLVFKPLRGELVEGNVVELMDFGAFIRMGPLDGLCHVSQICDDFITQDTKGSALMGKETGRILSEGDYVRARITSISFESGNRSGKLGLTMRQPFLGKVGPDTSWVEEDVRIARGEGKKEKKAKK